MSSSSRAAAGAFVLLALLLLVAGAADAAAGGRGGTKKSTSPDNVILENRAGFRVVLTPIGAAIQSVVVPSCTKPQKGIDVALGFDDVEAYRSDPHPSFGATVGRVANRISDAFFWLDGTEHKLLANEGRHSIHGGTARWSKAEWTTLPKTNNGRSVTFVYNSKEEAGFPGNVVARVTYSIAADKPELAVSMTATTDKATPINMLNHAYWNLKGAGNGDVLDHVVQVPSLYYTPSPPGDLLPTGQVLAVKDTIYDFTTPKPFGKDLEAANGGPYKGWDLNYVMPDPKSGAYEPVWWTPGKNPQVAADIAKRELALGMAVTEPASGLKLKVYTNAPGIHLYSGNFLNDKDGGSAGDVYPNKGGIKYKQHAGFCVETQAFPNAINTPGFPSIIVRPGETYNNRVTYAFSC